MSEVETVSVSSTTDMTRDEAIVFTGQIKQVLNWLAETLPVQ